MTRYVRACAVLFVTLWPALAAPPQPLRVKDINTVVARQAASDPGAAVEFGAFTYFPATTSAGRELWRTDGTVASLFFDLNPGVATSTPTLITVLGGKLLFLADDGAHGTELWVSDGTVAGTQLLVDINPGTGDGPVSVTDVRLGSFLYFTANDGTNGVELWRTDGTATGTTLVRDINPGIAASAPRLPCAMGNAVYFIADDAISGSELWRTDGTSGGTLMVNDQPAVSGAQGTSMVCTSTSVFFGGFTTAAGIEPWASDGTLAGTQQLADVVAGAGNSSPVFVANGARALILAGGTSVYASGGTPGTTLSLGTFTAVGSAVALGTGWVFGATDATNGDEPRVTDGTLIGTTLLRQIAAAATGSTPTSWFNAGAYAVFVATDGTTSSLWKTDGTTVGTVTLASMTAASGYLVAGAAVYFSGTDGSGAEPWRTDGTAAGTLRLADVNPGVADSTPVVLGTSGVRVLLAATDLTVGRELWRTDGTAPGTQLVADLYTGTVTGSSSPSDLITVGNYVYFRASDGVNTNQLWRSDGTDVGTIGLTIGLATSASVVDALPAGNRLAFRASDATNGSQLWFTDGTVAGTFRRTTGSVSPVIELLGSVGPRVFYVLRNSNPSWFVFTSDGTDAGTFQCRLSSHNFDGASYGVSLGSRVIFIADVSMLSRGFEPYALDGVDGGVTWLGDVNVAGSSIPTGNWVVSGGRAFVPINGGVVRTDGTPAGTNLVTGINVPAPGPNDRDAPFRNGVLYGASDGVHGTEPMYVTASAVTLLADIRDGGSGSSAAMFSVTSSFAIFMANDGIHGVEPYITDGTPAGTRMLADLNDSGTSNPRTIGTAGETVLFIATDSTGTRSLYATDGGSPVAIAPFSGNGSSAPPLRVYDRLYFVGNKGDGAEPWVSDGTAAGTHQMDVAPGTPSGVSNPYFARLGDKVFLAAADQNADRELYAVKIDESAPVITPVISGTLGTNGFYTSNVDLSWSVHDPESPVTFTSGCGPAQVTFDTPGTAFTCDAGSLGGGASVTTVIKRDTASPVVGCQSVPVIAEATSDAGAAVSYTPPSAQDTIDPTPVVSADRPPGSQFPLGDTTVTATATDAAGNSRQCTFVVSVVDRTPPALSCPVEVDVEATSPDGGTFTLQPTVSDAVDVAPVVVFSPPNGSLFAPGDRVATVTATDFSNNQSTCNTLVHVLDKTRPELECPPDQQAAAPGPTGATVTFPAPVATDAVDLAPSVMLNHASGDTFAVGTTRVQVIASDRSGNQQQCEFSVEVTCDAVACPPVATTKKSPYAFGFCGCSSPGPLLLAPLLLLFGRRRRRLGGFAALLALVAATAASAAEPGKKPKLGYVGVSAGVGVTAEEAKGVSELLQSELTATGAYEVITAADLSALLGLERQKQLLGCGDESGCMTEIAGALDVDRIVTGNVARTDDTVVMSLSLLDVRKSHAIARATRQHQTSRIEVLTEDAPEALLELVAKDPINEGREFKRQRRFGGFVLGARVDGDLLGLGAAPAICAELSGRWFGVALAVLIKAVPGVRLEGRFYPITLGRVRPWIAAGSTAFLTGIGLRGAIGAALRLGPLQVFLDLGYEHFFNLGTATTTSDVLVLGGGAGWAF